MSAFYDYMKTQLKLTENEFIHEIKKHPTIEGIYEIKYKVPAKDIYGNLTGEYKYFTNPKTVYDLSVITTEQIMEWGHLALSSSNVTVNNRLIEGMAPNDLWFRGYLNDNGEVKNIFPILKED